MTFRILMYTSINNAKITCPDPRLRPSGGTSLKQCPESESDDLIGRCSHNRPLVRTLYR